jgi:hypothetical protein
MLVLVDDEYLRSKMVKRAGELADSRSHQRYAEDFEAFITATLARPARSGTIALAARAAGRVSVFASRQHLAAPLIGQVPPRSQNARTTRMAANL